MTGPASPTDALRQALANRKAAQEAARQLSEDIARERTQTPDSGQQGGPEGPR